MLMYNVADRISSNHIEEALQGEDQGFCARLWTEADAPTEGLRGDSLRQKQTCLLEG